MRKNILSLSGGNRPDQHQNHSQSEGEVAELARDREDLITRAAVFFDEAKKAQLADQTTATHQRAKFVIDQAQVPFYHPHQEVQEINFEQPPVLGALNLDAARQALTARIAGLAIPASDTQQNIGENHVKEPV